MQLIGPRFISGNGLWNHFSQKKGYDIVCGSCGFTYHDKVPFVVDEARSICPGCQAMNGWKHSEFYRMCEATLRSVQG